MEQGRNIKKIFVFDKKYIGLLDPGWIALPLALFYNKDERQGPEGPQFQPKNKSVDKGEKT